MKTPDNNVLSVYLNVDPAQESNFNRGFESRLKNMISSIQPGITDPSELERFRNAARRVEEFVSAYRVDARGIALVLDEADGFFWWKELRISVDNQIRWGLEPFLLPLALALDEYEPYAVCLAGPVTHRLFVACCGEIEEVLEETFPSHQASLIQTVIIERSGPAHRIPREPAEELRRNLRHVVKDIDWIVQARELERVILAGAPSITGQLHKLLPKRLASLVIDVLDVATSASPEEVLALTLPRVERFERATEVETVNQLMSTAARGYSAVVALEPTLAALNRGRISKLVYSDGLRSSGVECTKCEALFSDTVDSCKVCGATLVSAVNVVERAIERALRQAAKIEAVKGQALNVLNEAGGIGAFLKPATRSRTAERSVGRRARGRPSSAT
jgi:intracellular sulfur oxidation DsrE/DsrF family protein